MNWTAFLAFWAVAFISAGFFLAIENGKWGTGQRSVWSHRALLIAGVIIASIAILTATP